MRQEDDAKDLIQEMFLKIFRRLNGNHIEMSPSPATRKDTQTLQ